jgi:threonine/homoserine/homoserine lactone efflux protein
MRNPARGLVLIVAAFVGLAAEIVSTVQDGISGAKVVALACFLFLFWYGWDLREKAKRKAPPKAQKPKAV